VCDVAGEYSTSSNVSGKYEIWEDKEFLSFICEKWEWESSPNILVTRNPNWSQRSGMQTDCVKGRY
jgi:hypothetical protein